MKKNIVLVAVVLALFQANNLYSSKADFTTAIVCVSYGVASVLNECFNI